MKIEGYADLHVLGKGGFATVYRADDLRHNRVVAIKVLDRIAEIDDDSRRRFDRECQAMGMVGNHPHIASIYDSGFDEEGRPFIVMEYYEHGALAQQLRSGRLNVAAVLRMGVEMSSALETAHRAGILHLDVKPENIFLSEFGDSALGDFGISAFADTQRTHQHAFTAHYASPELVERPAEVGPWSDLYSLGATLYTMVAGKPPFAGDPSPGEGSVIAVIGAVINNKPPPIVRADAPTGLIDVIFQLLEKSSDRRPTSGLEVAQHLNEVQRVLAHEATAIKVVRSDGLDSLLLPSRTDSDPSESDPPIQWIPASATTNFSDRIGSSNQPAIVEAEEDPAPDESAAPPAREIADERVLPEPVADPSTDQTPARVTHDVLPESSAGPHVDRSADEGSPPGADDGPGPGRVSLVRAAVVAVIAIGVSLLAYSTGTRGLVADTTSTTFEDVAGPALLTKPAKPTAVSLDPEVGGAVRVTWSYDGDPATTFSVRLAETGEVLASDIGANDVRLPAGLAPDFGQCVLVAAEFNTFVELSAEACR